MAMLHNAIVAIGQQQRHVVSLRYVLALAGTTYDARAVTL